MSKRKLSDEDFCRAAEKLDCSVAAIKTVAQVESRGDGFDIKDRPLILFERHKFAQYTNDKYSKTHPGISNRTAGGYGKYNEQYDRYTEAFLLDPVGAMLSTSWGKFQIMGFNFAICGFKTVDDFVFAMQESESRHLDAFVNYVSQNNLAVYLRNLDWAKFAKGYNGIDYERNNYHTKMAEAYKIFEKEKIDCSKFSLIQKAVLRIGDKGREVQELQEKLAEYKLLSEADADGFFGERTEMAVKAFQCLNGLTSDGIFGRETRKVLFG